MPAQQHRNGVLSGGSHSRCTLHGNSSSKSGKFFQNVKVRRIHEPHSHLEKWRAHGKRDHIIADEVIRAAAHDSNPKECREQRFTIPQFCSNNDLLAGYYCRTHEQKQQMLIELGQKLGFSPSSYVVQF